MCSITDGCRSYCKCKLCVKARGKLRKEWRWNNIKEGIRLIFQSKPERKVLNIKLNEIFTSQHYDLADPDYEWKLLKESIEAEGVKEPVHLVRLRDLDPHAIVPEIKWLERMANGEYYLPFDGHHRVAVAKFLALGDPLATIPCVIIPEMQSHDVDYMAQNYKANHTYFTSFFTPDTWDGRTLYGNIANAAKKKKKKKQCKSCGEK